MSYRRLILKRLRHFYDNAGSAHDTYLLLDPVDIVGKTLPGKRGKKYVAAINQLMREGLVLSVVAGGKPAFSLNPDRIDDVSSELHWWRNPAIIVIVTTLIGLGGLVWAVARFFLEK